MHVRNEPLWYIAKGKCFMSCGCGWYVWLDWPEVGRNDSWMWRDAWVAHMEALEKDSRGRGQTVKAALL